MSECRNVGMSECRNVGMSECRNVGMSDVGCRMSDVGKQLMNLCEKNFHFTYKNKKIVSYHLIKSLTFSLLKQTRQKPVYL